MKILWVTMTSILYTELIIFLCGPHNFVIPKFYHPKFFVDPQFFCWREQFKWNKFGVKKIIGDHNKFRVKNLGVKTLGSKIGHKNLEPKTLGYKHLSPWIDHPWIDSPWINRPWNVVEPRGLTISIKLIRGSTLLMKIIRGLTSSNKL